MKRCIYCNPEEDKSIIPIWDNMHTTVCVIGFTPIANRRKMGQLQIMDKASGHISYADIPRCPLCGQKLFVEND